ncbi:MAG: phosphoadenylyl-sulfate reductase [Bacteroidales bacterium]|jgi:phosphoadenosine phosphosulfate reductase|nr:phosphoadenylyl-sulfate reductase [Bacteroidales bacterium]HOL98030.1 phosphoadenylyl-sulfate reductase [Bacteroidales bacterium]HOM36541.1 phosphoadenylyl-sulfate reductase [Bacteroidales bacterium]HPD23718.1 phosphoadenylyl-sulfate reductase [Bacteroidales bacterium]HRS99833.1 phosphoadenylyl-sulfate reductase [Bacteroidales bacterium]
MQIEFLKNRLQNFKSEEILKFLDENYSGEVVFTTSFGAEDQVITDMICRNNLNIRIVTLDTGRLFEETYKVFYSTLEKYRINIEVLYPQNKPLEKLLSEKGPYSFYESVENRKECCYIRKVEPLSRAIRGYKVWVTGIRAEQSTGRASNQFVEYDEKNKIIKTHPVFRWTLKEINEYIVKNNVPYNSLHDKGYVSIGCAPCTRAIRPGEDFRAGRWWWEQNSGKECGLHSK